METLKLLSYRAATGWLPKIPVSRSQLAVDALSQVRLGLQPTQTLNFIRRAKFYSPPNQWVTGQRIPTLTRLGNDLALRKGKPHAIL
jgi:hypothetical protein